MRSCTDCGIEKPITEFPTQGRTSKVSGKPYRRHYCRVCRSARRRANPNERVRANANRREHYATDKRYRDGIKEQNRLHLYGVGAAWVAETLAAQGGVCAVCGTVPVGTRQNGWHIDHDHGCCAGAKSCGKCLRGVLCQSCNLALGHLHDDIDRVLSAAAYLLTFQDLFAGTNSAGTPNLQAGVSRMSPARTV